MVLASRSPQRRAILEQLGIAFTVVEPGVAEATEGSAPQLATENAVRKARAVRQRRTAPAGREGDELVLGADTVVALDGVPYGKPSGETEARAWLERLSGREHEVWGGIALLGQGAREDVSRARTRVRFRALSGAEIGWYVATGEWRERAGGYAIQGRGAALVESVEGDFWNVVGLPVAELVRLAPQLLVGSAAET